jgi:hypothetical protein
MKLIIFFLFLLLIPIASAFDCSKTLDQECCVNVGNSNITESEKDLLFSSLLYPYVDFPNHTFVKLYNLGILVTYPPYNTTVYNSVQIRNAWLSFVAVFPSVFENGTLFVSPLTNALSKHNHSVYIPPNYISSGYPATSEGDCKRTYKLVLNNATVNYYLNGAYKSTGDFSPVSVGSNGDLKSELTINTKLQVDHCSWERYCCKTYKGKCKRYCYRCVYSHTTYEPDKVVINEDKDIALYTKLPTASIVITNQYHNTTKGNFSASNYSYFRLNFSDSNIIKQDYYYDVIFDKKPYYFAYLEAHNFSRIAQKNIYLSNNTFFVKNASNCSLFAYNHFYNITSPCDLTVHQENVTGLSKEKGSSDLSILVYIITFLLIAYIIYRLIRSQAKKIVLPLLLILLVPVVFAAGEDECGITNLASCIPQKIYEFVLVIFNAPLLPMLAAVKSLLTAEVSIDIFQHVWSIMRYILGFFYIFFFLYAGYIFLTSNANPIRRAHAKEILKDTILMIVLIQGSYYIYEMLLHVSSVLDSTMLTMIDPTFFLLTIDNITNIGLELFLAMGYAITLLVTTIMLVLRYIVVSFGVVLFPIGLFCYFVPPLKGYGRFILNLLGIFVFITFFDILIILACSKLIDIPLFANMKIIVMITCFSIVNYTLGLTIKFAMKKSANSSIKDDLGQAMKYIALLA